MTSILVDSCATDDERRRDIYAGELFVFSPRTSTIALCQFARQMIEETFAGIEP
jgi:hypothetical protein